MQPLITLDEVKNYMGKSSSNNNSDQALLMLIDAVVPAFEGFCNRRLATREATSYRDGNGAARMSLTSYPLSNVVSVVIDKRTLNASEYFWSIGGRSIVLTGGRFTQGMRNVQIDYVAGFGDDANLNPWPSDLKVAACMWVTTRIKERERLGIGSQSLAGQTVTYDGTSGTNQASEGMPAAARSILSNYYNFVPESGV